MLVAEAVSTPRFWAGRENESRSPGSALNPMEALNVVV